MRRTHQKPPRACPGSSQEASRRHPEAFGSISEDTGDIQGMQGTRRRHPEALKRLPGAIQEGLRGQEDLLKQIATPLKRKYTFQLNT